MDGHLPVKGPLVSWVAFLRFNHSQHGKKSLSLSPQTPQFINFFLSEAFVLNAVEKAGTYPQSPRFSGLKALEDTGKYLLTVSPFFLFLL